MSARAEAHWTSSRTADLGAVFPPSPTSRTRTATPYRTVAGVPNLAVSGASFASPNPADASGGPVVARKNRLATVQHLRRRNVSCRAGDRCRAVRVPDVRRHFRSDGRHFPPGGPRRPSRPLAAVHPACPRYSAVCGYTERDLDEVFAPELPGLDRSASGSGTTATAGRRGTAVGVRRRRHHAGGAAAPDRLPDDSVGTAGAGADRVPAGYPNRECGRA